LKATVWVTSLLTSVACAISGKLNNKIFYSEVMDLESVGLVVTGCKVLVGEIIELIRKCKRVI
jgi:hypothetical protein